MSIGKYKLAEVQKALAALLVAYVVLFAPDILSDPTRLTALVVVLKLLGGGAIAAAVFQVPNKPAVGS